MMIDAIQPHRMVRPTPSASAKAERTDMPDGAGFSNELAAAAAPIGKGSRVGELEPLQKFESFVLRTFIDAMLPKENQSFFGEGTAGEIWRSMLAERIGDELAETGGIGIAELLAKDDSVAGRAASATDDLTDEATRARAAATDIR